MSDDIEFENLITDYYNHHHTKCISKGGTLSKADASGKAKEIISKAYNRKGKNILHAYYDGKNGLNGGMFFILDIIMEHLKEESLKHHLRDVIDRYIAPSNFDEKVAIVKEILEKIQINSSRIDKEKPERYAHDYDKLIRLLMQTKSIQGCHSRKFRTCLISTT